MSMIRMALIGGALVYALLFGIEFIQGHVFWQAIIGTVAVILIAALPFVQDEHALHRGEMIMIWICVLLFGLYALLKSGGIA